MANRMVVKSGATCTCWLFLPLWSSALLSAKSGWSKTVIEVFDFCLARFREGNGEDGGSWGLGLWEQTEGIWDAQLEKRRRPGGRYEKSMILWLHGYEGATTDSRTYEKHLSVSMDHQLETSQQYDAMWFSLQASTTPDCFNGSRALRSRSSSSLFWIGLATPRRASTVFQHQWNAVAWLRARV